MMRSVYGALAAAIVSTTLGACSHAPARAVVLATTTSVVSSGLLEELAPSYRQKSGRNLNIVPVGSGRALKMLEAAQADVAITHAPAQEATMLTRHPVWTYRKILYNRFLIVGPPDDPARASGAADAAEAMRRIAAGSARFVSRGDESGTHERERQLWAAAGATPASGRLVVAGAGMGETLRIASETQSYTLTDEGTLRRLAAQVALRTVSSGDPVLLNTYAVVADKDNEHGQAFAEWLAAGAGHRRLERILKDGRVQGFSLWPQNRPTASPSDLPW